MMEEGRLWLEGDRLFPCVDQIPVLLSRLRRFAEVENSVLGVENSLPAGGLVFRNHFRKADAQIDIGTVLNVLRRAPSDLRVRQLDVFMSIDGHT